MKTGELVQWNDGRGFGFIVTSERERFFVHVTDIGRIATRPRVGDQLRFQPALGADGRPVARRAVILGANPVLPSRSQPSPRNRFRVDWRYLAAALVIGLIGIDWSLGALPVPVLAIYGAMSCLSLLTYAADKAYATSGQWRVREASLHGLDLFGGIAGGLMAQAILRHKTRKPGFRNVTVLIFALHALGLAGLGFGLGSFVGF